MKKVLVGIGIVFVLGGAGYWLNSQYNFVAKLSSQIKAPKLLDIAVRQKPSLENDKPTTKRYQSTYQIPKHIVSKQQLREKGAECNTYGKSDCSIAVYSKILKIDPYDVSARANLAFALTSVGAHDQAIPEYKKVLSQGKGTYDTHGFYAESLLATGNKKDALKHYQKALEINPNLVDVAERVALLLAEEDKSNEALNLIEKFIEKHPDMEPQLRSLRARLATQTKNSKEL